MFHIPTPDELKKLRKEANLTQSELANIANVSQSLIARIENNTIDPRISTLKKILNAIYDSKENKKKAIDFAIKKVITVSDQDNISNATDIMNKKGISQLIVLDKNQNIIGSIREKSITKKLLEKGEEILKQKIIDQIDESLPEISANASLDEIKSLVIENDAVVLVLNGEIKGIITKADIIKHFQNF
ncbi:MAG: helix-turn-helix domain-containing protein [Candidatus Lokiarchaeota archaeon]|nr:helix-turn-helix domain-containing protein [Candidatus Lokiarchaeota archaeon]